mgnify:CR=1 FL=1|jgi:hypothetical protein
MFPDLIHIQFIGNKRKDGDRMSNEISNLVKGMEPGVKMSGQPSI